MEQASYNWMWTKRKHNTSSFGDDSWEEQAFAEDAAGPLGGFVWPPRSYNCSFCRREFRSAQALGGHMNVHRRDRARLKQSSSLSPQDDHQQHLLLHQNHQNPSRISSFFSKPNSDSDLLALPSPKIYDFKAPGSALFRSSSPVVLEEHRKRIKISSAYSRSKLEEEEEEEKKKGSKVMENMNISRVVEGNFVTTDLSVSSINLESMSSSSSCKKRKRDSSASLSLFAKDIPSSMEDLDLELRLGGDPPKVK